MSVLDGLRVALNQGWRLLPCRPEDAVVNGKKLKAKSPLTRHGVKDASDELSQIAEWARQYPGCAWGAAMGNGVFALDVDSKNGAPGEESLAALEAEHGPLPPTLTNRTWSGGRQLLFSHEPQVSFKNSVSEIAPGMDVRSDGGFVIVPDSSVYGKPYIWERPELDPTPMPAWLRQIAPPAGARKKASNDWSTDAPDGTRNARVFAYASMLRMRNLPETDAWQALWKWNSTHCVPPLDDSELRDCLDHAWKYPAGFAHTDLGLAERLVAQHGEDLRHLPELGWLNWDGARWKEDRESRIVVLASRVVRSIAVEAADEPDEDRRKRLLAHALKSESRKTLDAMVSLARSRPEVVDLLERYDRSPMLLGVRNGVVDLTTGKLREGRRDDRITQQADVEFIPGAGAPRWRDFLSEIFDKATDMIAFAARAAGYSMTGSNEEQVLFVAYGTGGNGKSKFINVLRRVMGDYARAIQPETLMARDRSGGIPNDIARLRGVRFVPTVEVEDGRKLAESLIKQLTGGDAVTARFMRQEFFDFVPVAKIWLATNHRPVIAGTDNAIWRRIVLVPFTVTISESKRDKDIEEKLFAEAPGILNWLIEGCRDWRANGLAIPKRVADATAQYRSDMDRIGQFLEEKTARRDAGRGYRTRKTLLYAKYVEWSQQSGHRYPLTKRVFHEKLRDDHRLTLVKVDGYDLYDGLVLVTEEL